MEFDIQMFADYDLDDALKVEHGAKFAERTGYLLRKKLGVVEDAQDGNVATLNVDGNVVGSKHGVATTDEFRAMLKEYLPKKKLILKITSSLFKDNDWLFHNCYSIDEMFKNNSISAEYDGWVEDVVDNGNGYTKVTFKSNYEVDGTPLTVTKSYNSTTSTYFQMRVSTEPTDKITTQATYYTYNLWCRRLPALWEVYKNNPDRVWATVFKFMLEDGGLTTSTALLTKSYVLFDFDAVNGTLLIESSSDSENRFLKADLLNNSSGKFSPNRIFYEDFYKNPHKGITVGRYPYTYSIGGYSYSANFEVRE